MPTVIAIASGKGGTGKTLVATGLARTVAADGRSVVHLIDCDVEEPNAHLFLHPELVTSQEVTLPLPRVELSQCSFCGRCAEVCAFHAVAVVGEKVLVFPELCHGCGSCARQCPSRAISEEARHLGRIDLGRAGEIRFAQGLLDVGEAMATPIIRALKQRVIPAAEPSAVVFLDAPPGNACPVVETLRHADLALLVTEPTPFGRHDLAIAVEVARDQLGLPVGVVVNRDGTGDASVDTYCADAGVPILLRIPHERRIAEAYSEGRLWVDELPEYREPLLRLYTDIRQRVGARP